MRRAVASGFAWGVCLAVFAPAAGAHSAFLGSTPEPGTRLSRAPLRVTLSFTESLNDRLSKATLVDADGKRVTVSSAVSGKRLAVTPTRRLARGAYRVSWHTVSTEDGHALEGSFSFGVRAPAVGNEHDVQVSPLARDGWVRVLARSLLYASLLIFAGALILDVLLSRRGESWLVPAPLRAVTETLDPENVARRARRLVLDVGFAAAGAATVAAVADAADAASGLSARGLSDFLLAGGPGLTRLSTIGLVLLAVTFAALRRSNIAALVALGALLSVALSGHANASSPRALAVANDWIHLAATATWLGGIALIVLVWSASLRRASSPDRVAVAQHVLPRFGRVALPAFAVVVLSGLVSALIELGHVSALWQTDYGRVLMVKVSLVAFIVAASYMHALRLRPRLLAANPRPEPALERRHWRLLRSEPLLGLGAVVAVALLVAFPLPPRQISGAEEAAAKRAAPACETCPLPRLAKGEIAVAEQGGSDVVAAWLRREGRALRGTVRLYGLTHVPAKDRFKVLSAAQGSCGAGCLRFRADPAPVFLRVAVRQRGRWFTARLPVRWVTGMERLARRLMARAQRAMRELRSVRLRERVSSVPGRYATTDYQLQAPDRMAFQTNGAVRSVVIGDKQWTRERDAGWTKAKFGGGLPFRTRSWFVWTTYARHAFLLGRRVEAGRPVAVVGLFDQGTPAFWRLHIDLRSHRVLDDRLVTYGHFMTQRFSAINQPLRITPPRKRVRGG